MPTYIFKDKETGEISEHKFRMTEHTEFKKKNPHLEQVINYTPSIGDPVRLGITTTDNGFKEVLSKIHEQSGYGSTLGQNLSRAKTGIRNAIPTVGHKK
tara:strand:- start:1157 stop:1453 length:297 start_codon:yes stop_codon:yes gene_type:complete